MSEAMHGEYSLIANTNTNTINNTMLCNTIANTINYTEKYITNQEQQSTLSQD